MTFIALTIAGSDSSGGAGIQADLKTFSAMEVYGASVITAITAQNTLSVKAIENVSPAMIAAQIDMVLNDLDVKSIKIGMVSCKDSIVAIADRLEAHRRRIILDPVMVATSGDKLLEDRAITALMTRLLPLADLVTPNIAEAALLSGMPRAKSFAEMEEQASIILHYGPRAVLMKGGHSAEKDSTDILFTAGGQPRFYSAPRLDTKNNHGTGCSLSAAIAAQVAIGEDMPEAVATAKAYLHGALEAADQLRIGSGNGPVHHFYKWWPA
ncbi:bifunctional hydroxymethylpyrimidine kinase/phosphomethylpyrimidine kinase [Aureimonas fodinaquatilis]|uniref:hydroxymethylpyrimidine kinase n=1 Tax=Aureimonas fodinaquatilis TaxID=2565783 RepID=A0A5B0DRH7_9HYPH|nr:bifunctional hydroxymethylpyrimidine kinase/phosphomethylpyrimidine kinase [Aureimonas fodinaquatilis]KAA0968150.1 bifunctional hydroxymethylpyrimidine kinase/phosphomethylpyrimidine kinase [Aureimonas fodinaquatilis]